MGKPGGENPFCVGRLGLGSEHCTPETWGQALLLTKLTDPPPICEMGAGMNQPSPIPGTGGVWTQWVQLRESKVSLPPGWGALKLLPLPPSLQQSGEGPLVLHCAQERVGGSRPPSLAEDSAWETGFLWGPVTLLQ